MLGQEILGASNVGVRHRLIPGGFGGAAVCTRSAGLSTDAAVFMVVIRAKAGIQGLRLQCCSAFVGMTTLNAIVRPEVHYADDPAAVEVW